MARSVPRVWPDVALVDLPELAPADTDLAPEASDAVVDDWSYRAGGEFAASMAFAAVAANMWRFRPEPPVAWLLTRAVSDEMRHAEICRTVASRFAGSDLPWPEPPEEQAVAYPGVPDAMVHLVMAIHMSCISETIGAAFLRACLAETRVPLIKSSLKALLTDEVDHSRVGWALLASDRRTSSERRFVAEVLPLLVDSGRRAWRERMKRASVHYPAGYGLLPEVRLLELVDEAIAELVLPGLEHVGLDVEPIVARLRSVGFEIEREH